MTRAHALLGASGAHRWMNCPGSIRLSEGIESKSSIYADEGTAAHTLAERCLSHQHNADRYLGRVIDIAGKEPHEQLLLKGSPLTDSRFDVTEEMVDAVQLFLDTVREEIEDGDELVVEHRVSLGDDMFGTADAIVVKRAKRRIKVFDLKYGAGLLVEVKGNPQLIYYGEGAFRAVEDKIDDFDGLDITIVQPRLYHKDGPVRTVEVDPLELFDWSIQIAAAAEATRDPEAAIVAGEWCRWCPASGACPAHATKALAVAQQEFDDLDALPTVELPAPELLTPEQLAKVLDGAKLLTNWVESVRQFAYSQAEGGNRIPGYKLVNKIPRRHWTDEDLAIAKIAKLGITEEAMFTAPKLKSPAQIEKLVGKKDYKAVLAEIAPAVSSGTTLAPLDDNREEIVRAIESEFEDLDEPTVTMEDLGL